MKKTISYDAILNKKSVKAKLDPGESHAFMSKTAAKQCNIKIASVHDVTIELGDNPTMNPIGISSAELTIDAIY